MLKVAPLLKAAWNVLSQALISATVAGVVVALASQNQLSSPSTGTVSGLQLTNNFNNAIDSVNTANGGASAPTNQLSGVPSTGNLWLNTTSNPYPLGMYDGAQWPAIGYLDVSAHQWDMQVGGGTATIASATTTSLCSVPQYFMTVSGTTTITALGTGCVPGQEKTIQFSGILTFTYNATSLIIPGAANVTTSDGDIAKLIYLGSGNWQVEAYFAANGQPLINPAIDVGDVVMTHLTAPPSSKYLFEYGQTISRTTYATLMSSITIAESVTRTNGSPTLTGFSDTTQIGAGACVEGSGIPNSGSCTTSIVSCASTTCTLSGNATSSGTASVTIFPYGNGDGSTTFTLPDCRGVAFTGRDNMGGTPRSKLTSTYAGASPDALGVTLGAQSQTLTAAQLPSNIPYNDPGHSHTVFTNNISNVSGSNPAGVANSGSGDTTSTSTVGITINPSGGNAHSIVPPMLTANCMIRALAKLELPLRSRGHELPREERHLALRTENDDEALADVA